MVFNLYHWHYHPYWQFGEFKKETKHVEVNDNKTSQNRRAGADACDGALYLDLFINTSLLASLFQLAICTSALNV